MQYCSSGSISSWTSNPPGAALDYPPRGAPVLQVSSAQFRHNRVVSADKPKGYLPLCTAEVSRGNLVLDGSWLLLKPTPDRSRIVSAHQQRAYINNMSDFVRAYGTQGWQITSRITPGSSQQLNSSQPVTKQQAEWAGTRDGHRSALVAYRQSPGRMPDRVECPTDQSHFGAAYKPLRGEWTAETNEVCRKYFNLAADEVLM